MVTTTRSNKALDTAPSDVGSAPEQFAPPALAPDSGPRGTEPQPAWVSAELPDEYAEIERKIAQLRQDARQYERFAEMLWCSGEPLTLAVRDAFTSMGFQVHAAGADDSYDLLIELDAPRRLLVEVVSGVTPLDKRAPAIARAFRAIQEEAGPGDRVVFVANIPSDKPVSARHDPPTAPDALRVIQGLGANVITTATLFGLWRYSMKDLPGARNSIHLLHALDGGIFR
jgi:hypothetical protein